MHYDACDVARDIYPEALTSLGLAEANYFDGGLDAARPHIVAFYVAVDYDLSFAVCLLRYHAIKGQFKAFARNELGVLHKKEGG